MTKELPRVLVVSPFKFNTITGGGVTMGALFKGWPLDRIAQLHSDAHTEPDLAVCQEYLYVPGAAAAGKPGLRALARLGRDVAAYILRRKESLLGHWLHTERLLAWCRAFAPDVIFARLHDRPSFYNWLPVWLGRQLGAPYVTWVLDDWPRRYQRSPRWPNRLIWRWLVSGHVRRAFEQAAANVGISPEMADAFAQRYGRPFTFFHNCIDFDEWTVTANSYQAGQPFRIVYVGSVVEDKELHSLVDLRRALNELDAAGHRVQLTIYGRDIFRSTVAEYLEQPPIVVHGGLFADEERASILAQADLLLLPINFDERSGDYVQYSFQTKVPEYMASGTPTLVYGPPSSPNVRYARQEEWAAVVDRPDPDVLQATLARLIEDESLRQTLGQRARRLAREHHDAARVRTRFRELLHEAAQMTPHDAEHADQPQLLRT